MEADENTSGIWWFHTNPDKLNTRRWLNKLWLKRKASPEWSLDPESNQNIHRMKQNDTLVWYSSGHERKVKGIGKVVSDSYTQKRNEKDYFHVRVKLVFPLANGIPFSVLRHSKVLDSSRPVKRNTWGTFLELKRAEFDEIRKIAVQTDPGSKAHFDSVQIPKPRREVRTWRMAFRIGDRGPEMWPDCFKRGIAAIGYYDSDGYAIVEDCSRLSEEEYNEIWRRERPKASSARNSLKNLAYKMKEGDTIYVKEGPYIVGKGVVTREYKHDPKILEGAQVEWEHYVTVAWDKMFPKFRLVLGADQNTVLLLQGERLRKIHEKEYETHREVANRLRRVQVFEAKEGARYLSEASFRKRNALLIETKKLNSDYRCEVCHMSFEERYGDIGKEYIIAHHKTPIASRKGSSKTSLDDIALVCANCHDMIHRDGLMSIAELRRRVRP